MMKLLKPCCPQCNSPAIGAADLVPGVALFDGDPSKEYVDYVGETKIFWDGQINWIEFASPDCANPNLALIPGTPPAPQFQVQCDNGHEWITLFKESES